MTRRGESFRFDVPIYQAKPSSINKNVTLDHTIYGCGCCCLQVTFQAVDFKQALYLHDQLATLAPLMLALTAASPIFKGYLCDRDSRWDIVAAGVDDRNAEERKFKVKHL